jgi:hypothetical protein
VFHVDNSTVAVPSGWTSVASGSFGIVGWAVGWINYVSGVSSLTFTVGTASSRYAEAIIGAFTGIDTTTPVAGTPAYTASGSSQSSSTYPDPPSADVGTSSLVICAGMRANGGIADGTFSAPTGYTAINTLLGGSVAFAYSSSLLSGTQNPAAFGGATLTGTWDGWNGFTAGLAAAVANVAMTPGQGTPTLMGRGVSLAHTICLPDQP